MAQGSSNPIKGSTRGSGSTPGKVMIVTQQPAVQFKRSSNQMPVRSAPARTGATFRHPSAGRAAVAGKRKV